MRPATEARYEKKFTYPGDSAARLIHRVLLLPGRFAEIHGRRTVNNLYLDTLDNDCLAANISGLDIRRKYRFRWYGDDPLERQPVAFEIKERAGDAMLKTVAPLDQLAPAELFDRARLNRILAEVGVRANCALPFLEPRLQNRYSRTYYRSADRSVRITVDDRLAFCRSTRFRPNYGGRSPRIVIVEMKYSPENHRASAGLSQRLGRTSKFSKYVAGMVGDSMHADY